MTFQRATILRALPLLAGAAVLVGVTAFSGATQQAAAVLTGNTAAVQQAPDDGEKRVKTDPKVGFLDKSRGAPVVKRPGEKPLNERAKAPVVPFTDAATFKDGVKLTTGNFARGTVTSEGRGIITGAPYVVLTISLTNDSKKALDLSTVVVTLKYGEEKNVAAPLYDDVTVQDFTGSLAPGSSVSAAYAFQLPTDVSEADLYVDIDGEHAPATFSGVLPG